MDRYCILIPLCIHSTLFGVATDLSTLALQKIWNYDLKHTKMAQVQNILEPTYQYNLSTQKNVPIDQMQANEKYKLKR